MSDGSSPSGFVRHLFSFASVLEEDAITHAIPETGDRHRGSASQKQPVRLPLQCAVWSYAGEGNTKSSRKQACNVASGKGYFVSAVWPRRRECTALILLSYNIVQPVLSYGCCQCAIWL